VQCLLDKDCPAPFVCATVTKTCVACTATNQSSCRADLGGARCVAGDSCGCAMDADCGGTTSGRVCDATTARCVPGCRATGGNGCPTSLLCTSAGNDIGVCQPRPVMTDGGADGSSDAPSSSDAAEGGAIDGPPGDLAADGVVGADAPVDVSTIDGAGDASDGGAGGGGGAGYGAGGGYIAGGGCRCDAGGSGSSPATFVTLALAVVGAVVRRRRRR
jgi:MYXO-CTERM domain-containing protein